MFVTTLSLILISQLTRLLHKMSKFKDDVDPDVAVKFFDAMQRIEDDLQSRGTPFFSGEYSWSEA